MKRLSISFVVLGIAGLVIVIPSFGRAAERQPSRSGVSRTTAPARTKVSSEAQVRALKTVNEFMPIKQGVACIIQGEAEEDCDREDCNNFYRALHLFNAVYKSNPGVPRVITGPFDKKTGNPPDVGLASADELSPGLDCVGYPKEAFANTPGAFGPFANLAGHCAYNKDKTEAIMQKAPMCSNFSSQENRENYKLMIADNPTNLGILNTLLENTQVVLNQGVFDPSVHVPVCVEVGLNLLSWADPCAVNCCSK